MSALCNIKNEGWFFVVTFHFVWDIKDIAFNKAKRLEEKEKIKN